MIRAKKQGVSGKIPKKAAYGACIAVQSMLYWPHQLSPRSSMAEQRTLNATVRGSTPLAGISFFLLIPNCKLL